MTTKKYIAACGVQLLACGALFAVEPEWSTVIFDCASIEQCEITDGHFRIFNEGGPDGKPAVVFDDSVNNGGTIGVDLYDLDINFNE